MPPQRLKSCPHGPMCHIEFVSQEASWERLDCSVHTGSWRSWGQNWRRNWRLLSSSCSRKLIARPIANLKKLLGPLGLLGPVATLGQPFLRESGRPHQGHGRGSCCQAGKVLARALDAYAETRREFLEASAVADREDYYNHQAEGQDRRRGSRDHIALDGAGKLGASRSRGRGTAILDGFKHSLATQLA